jgi:glycoside hydrolase-like protein
LVEYAILHFGPECTERKMAFAALDTSQNSRNLIACMRERGITAIGRYYTKRRTNSKILTADEARRLSDAGIRTWVVYQNRHREPVDFSPVKGKLEAEDALDYAKNVINQPAGSGIYFSADFDAAKPRSIALSVLISRPSPPPLPLQAILIASASIARARSARACWTQVWSS